MNDFDDKARVIIMYKWTVNEFATYPLFMNFMIGLSSRSDTLAKITIEALHNMNEWSKYFRNFRNDRSHRISNFLERFISNWNSLKWGEKKKTEYEMELVKMCAAL